MKMNQEWDDVKIMKLQSLKSKHRQLRKADGGSLFKGASYKVFGSESHKYRFNHCLTESEVMDFERMHGVRLPDDYRDDLRLRMHYLLFVGGKRIAGRRNLDR